MSNYFEVDANVLGLAAEIISHHHPGLVDAKIGFIFQEEASKRNGRIILGNASKVSEKQRIAGLDLDYIITIAYDWWKGMTFNQKKALIDHELCHCDYDDGDAKIKGHDIEEFKCIVDRYGLWRTDLIEIAPSFEKAIQMKFETLPKRGEVVAVSPAAVKE